MDLTVHKLPYPHIKESEIVATLTKKEKELYDDFMLGKTCCRDEKGVVGIYPNDYYAFLSYLEKQN